MLHNHVATSVGFMSSSDKRVHFGLGAEAEAQLARDPLAEREDADARARQGRPGAAGRGAVRRSRARSGARCSLAESVAARRRAAQRARNPSPSNRRQPSPRARRRSRRTAGSPTPRKRTSRFLAQVPASWEGHSNLGVVYAQLGRHEDAVREYREALAPQARPERRPLQPRAGALKAAAPATPRPSSRRSGRPSPATSRRRCCSPTAGCGSASGSR